MRKNRTAIQIKRDWINHQPLRGSRKAVLRCLVDHANNKTDKCYPSQARICEETGVSINTVSRSIRVLEAVGLIGVERKKFDRQGRVGVKNTYTVHYGIVATDADVKAAEKALKQPRPKSHGGTLVGRDQNPTMDRPKPHHGAGTINKNSPACGDASQLSIFRSSSDSCFGGARAAAYRCGWRRYGGDGEVIWELIHD